MPVIDRSSSQLNGDFGGGGGVQEQEPELQLAPQQRAARLGKLHGALLVVASLIDKPTNLGGQRIPLLVKTNIAEISLCTYFTC